MVTLFLVLNALRTQAATLRARSAIRVTWGLQDKSAETITPKSLTILEGYNMSPSETWYTWLGWQMGGLARCFEDNVCGKVAQIYPREVPCCCILPT